MNGLDINVCTASWRLMVSHEFTMGNKHEDLRSSLTKVTHFEAYLSLNFYQNQNRFLYVG